jgi:glucose/arabinose dehydrogenase
LGCQQTVCAERNYRRCAERQLWEDDTWEVFIDENASGGIHTNTYNAFAYHTSITYDLVDVDVDQKAKLFNNHGNVKRVKNGNTYTWEAAFDVYTDQYVYTSTTNPKAILTAGKKMGYALAYCDNDGGTARQSFIGSEDIPGTDKNVAYQNASVFGSLELVDEVTASFSHVKVGGTLTTPTAMTIAPDGRIFVCEQQGTLRVIQNGTQVADPVLSVSVEASGFYTERGLIGVTVDPDFVSNNYIYLFYTTTQNGTHNRVSRFTLNGNKAVAGSETIILELDPLSTANNHNGGGMQFGKDGKLYIATGENATPTNAQDLTNTHGKILRINKDGSVPSDNPFQTNGEKAKKFWAYGLRNPFTFDVQPSTGRIFVNDVGQEAWEEINDITIGGKNFGWPTAEGMSTNPSFTNPVFTYQHTLDAGYDDQGCAITGGTFFNPTSTNYPTKYTGKYFFMDFCNNWIAVLNPETSLREETFAKNVANAPIAIDVHPDGNLYYLSRDAGVYKITYSGNLIPEIIVQPKNNSIPASQPVSFFVQVTGASPITYAWYKDGNPIPNSNNAMLNIATVASTDAGKYKVIVSNTYGSDTSSEVTLTVTAFNSRPEATITSPVNNSLFSGDQVISIAGNATDTQDGTLPAAAFSWTVSLHHDDHIHDGVPQTGMKNFTFTVPSTGHTETTIFYRIKLIVTDVGGLKDTAYVDIKPNLVNLTFATTPAGLKITLDGQALQTPATIPSIAGIKRTIAPVAPQSSGGKAYEFDQWLHGGTVSQTITTPSSVTTYTAAYKELPITDVVISPIHDAYIQANTSWLPNGETTTFGTENPNELVTKTFTEGPNRQTYLTFNLAGVSLSGGNQLITAKLKLFGKIEDATGEKTIVTNLFESNNTTWTENTITYANRPGYDAAKLVASNTLSGVVATDYYWDVTNALKTVIATSKTAVSFVIINTGNNVLRAVFNSKEAASNRPELFLSIGKPSAAEYAETTESLNIYPNPAQNELFINMNTAHSGNADISLLDMMSNVVINQSTQMQSGQNQIRLELAELKSGMYIVQIKNGNSSSRHKVMVK